MSIYTLGKKLDTLAAHSSGMPFSVQKNNKAFARAKTKAGAELIAQALNQGVAPAPEAPGKLEAFQALANAGVMITLPIDDNLPSVLCLKNGVMYVLEGHELFSFGAGACKVSQTFFKKHYGAALYSPLQDLLMAEAVRLGLYEEVELSEPAPAKKPVLLAEPSPVVASPVKKAKPGTVKDVDEAWKANMGQAWPDPQA